MTALTAKVAVLAGAAVLLLAASRADAEIVFCNKFPYLVYVAIAYPQTDDSNSWVSRGWLNIDTGNCAEFDTALHVTALYYRAESDTYRDQGHSVSTVWGGGGDGKFAILENSNFNFWNAQTKVLNSRLAAFTKIGETTGEALSMRLTFEADGTHTTTTIHGNSAPKQ